MMDASRVAAAQGAIAECKSRSSSYYANEILQGLTPSGANVLTSLGATPNLGSDFTVSAAQSGTSDIAITVSAVKGVALSANVVGTWYFPTS
jgi:hypothetical protein